MIHVVADRPNQKIKLYDVAGLIATYTGNGDAWGNHPGNPGDPPYGLDCWCPPGHYLLQAPQFFPTPIPSEGFGQIPVVDIDDATLRTLISGAKAKLNANGTYTIGGIDLSINQLSRYNRSAIMLHGGGSNAVDPYADYQTQCATEGCERMYNAEWKKLAGFLAANQAGNTIVYSVVGDPVTLTC
jgi:hypothetical protein